MTDKIADELRKIADASRRADGTDIPLGMQVRTAADVIDAKDKRIAELEAGGWLPIETAPKDGTEIIARCSPQFVAFSCFWRDGAWLHYDHDDGLIAYRPTEWLSFPAPSLPAGGANG